MRNNTAKSGKVVFHQYLRPLRTMSGEQPAIDCVRRVALTVLFVAVLCAWGFAESSDHLSLSFPVACDLHTDCFIQNYFDHDSREGFSDYRCGRLGYDGHDGTDIRLPNLNAMQRGVSVLAAASGIVRATRDRLPDISVREIGRAAVRGVEAGNAVVLRHGEDWETQYSHLQRGSVQVRPGDRVNAGDLLGRVGLSGNTEFPHVHFEVRYQGEPVDPFVGLTRDTSCEAGLRPLWSNDAEAVLEYRSTGLLQSGFSTVAPDARTFTLGSQVAGTLTPRAPALIFWVEIYGAQAGAEEHIRIVDPRGKMVAEKRARIKSDKARWARYVGRKRPRGGWPPGTYSAYYELNSFSKDSPPTPGLLVKRNIRVTSGQGHLP